MKGNSVLMNVAATVVLALLIFSGTQVFADDMFVKVDGIEGESVDRAHEKEIDAQSYSLGITTPISFTTGGIQAGKPVFKELTITKYLDKATPKLMLASASGQHIREVVLTVRTPGDRPFNYLKITLSDVIVSSVSDGGASYERATEALSFAYARISMEYTPQNPDGTAGALVSFGWDILASRPL